VTSVAEDCRSASWPCVLDAVLPQAPPSRGALQERRNIASVGPLYGRRRSNGSTTFCSTTPEALHSWLWALVLGSRVVGGVSPLWRATAACERLRRTCLGELVGLSRADSGACQSRLGSVMHWRELSAS